MRKNKNLKNRDHARLIFHACTAAFLFLFPLGCGRDTPRPKTFPETDPLIGAYYYLWYPSNFSLGILRRTINPQEQPMLGWYDSGDRHVAEQHIAWCSEYGIDFLAVGWWPNRPEQNKKLDGAFLKAKNLKDVRFCIFYETWNLGFDPESGNTAFNDKTTKQFISDIKLIAKNYFSNPSYLKIGGRPVLILYLTRTFSGQFRKALSGAREEALKMGHDLFIIGDEIFWSVTKVPGPANLYSSRKTALPQSSRISLFDAITCYNYYEAEKTHHKGYPSASGFIKDVRDLLDQYKQACPDTAIVPNIIPGYNDRGPRRLKNNFPIPRKYDPTAPEGSTFEAFFEQIGMENTDPRLNMLLITSFNEWNEDTAIEPLKISPPSNENTGQKKYAFTCKYEYSGFGMTYLEIIKNKTKAVSGKVTNSQNGPLAGVPVIAFKNGQKAAEALSDCNGIYNLPRYHMKEGEFEIGISDSPEKITIKVDKNKTISNVNFIQKK